MNCGTSFLLNTSSKDIKNLSSELREEWDKLQCQNHSELKDLRAIVEWKRKKCPDFKRTGRSAFHQLEKPIQIPNSNLKIKALKIKGVGARTHTGETFRPTCESVCNNNPHLGFDPTGKFIGIKTVPAPTGGITLSRAMTEFDVSKHLFEHNCPSIIPLQVYRYTDPEMTFLSGETQDSQPEPLGVVITGLPDSSYLRVDSIFNYHCLNSDEKAELETWMNQLGISSRNNPALSLITALSRLYGKTIRKFSESGLYRYSGAPDNYSYCVDTGEVFLIDLDSSRKLETISPVQQSLEIMRDAASGIAYLLAFFTDPRLIQFFPSKDVIAANPFRELLIGYYSDVDRTYIDEKSRIIIDYYQEVYGNSPACKTLLEEADATSERSQETVQEFRSYLSRSYMRPWISRSDTFSYLMPICWLFHQASEIRKYAPDVLDQETLFENIAEYEMATKGRRSIAERVKRSLEL